MPSREELESRKVAEDAREQRWSGDSFLRSLFLGRFRIDLVDPFPVGEPDRPEFTTFYRRLEAFLRDEVDPVAIDATGEYPRKVISGLAELGAFGMKIPKEYQGLGLSHTEYVRVMQLVGSHDANVAALLSAHQAIGVPQPVKLFGSESLKARYLPRCARGAISAFALTEPAVGSDPARLGTIAEASDDGTHFVLNGEKLWCTNGTLAECIVVMARDPRTDRINCFVVEMDWPGVHVDHRCHFMGLRALGNAAISFRDVRIPRENLIGEEGHGLKIALVTLNTGRLSLPATTSGAMKQCIEVVRKWSNARVQWGVPIGKHEVITHKLADLASVGYAMESLAYYVADLADREGVDLRLEAAAAKEWNSVRYWEAIDETLQIRGGRGYETEASLRARGEPSVGIERMMRDARINLIFEGSSEIMHLFMAREAVDEHLRLAGTLVDPHASLGAKLRALPRVVAHYARWYPSLWIARSPWPRFRRFGPLGRYLRFAERMGRKLAREVFHGMLVYRAGLERKQAFLFRAVDIAIELLVLTASVTRAHAMAKDDPRGRSALVLADAIGQRARVRVRDLFRDMWRNDDAARSALGRQVLAGEHEWFEHGSIRLPYSIEELTPQTVGERLAHRDEEDASRSGERSAIDAVATKPGVSRGARLR